MEVNFSQANVNMYTYLQLHVHIVVQSLLSFSFDNIVIHKEDFEWTFIVASSFAVYFQCCTLFLLFFFFFYEP